MTEYDKATLDALDLSQRVVRPTAEEFVPDPSDRPICRDVRAGGGPGHTLDRPTPDEREAFLKRMRAL